MTLRTDIPRLACATLAMAFAVNAGGAIAWEPHSDHGAGPGVATVDRQPRAIPIAPPPVVFDGFGLSDFGGSESVAAALEHSVSDNPTEESMVEFKGIDVRGPGGSDLTPIPVMAVVRSRIDMLDVAAGVAANPEKFAEGPSQWTGRIGLSQEREFGRESFELRTTLVPTETTSVLGVSVGPRFERRLRRGLMVFIDGQAEAQATRPADAGWWAMPGRADGSVANLGVTARTGIVR